MEKPKAPKTFDGSVFPATMLLREVIDSSAAYSRMVGSKLAVNETDFTAMQHLIMNGPMTAGQLADAVGVSPGSATVMIDRLESVGHVTREPNPADRRGVLVVPKPESINQAWALIGPLIEASEVALTKLSPSERNAIEIYLDTMLAIYKQNQ
jgi:DNA-binding MarR family transcriptional regulator